MLCTILWELWRGNRWYRQEAILDSSDQIVILENGHILQKLDLAIKEKYIRVLLKSLLIHKLRGTDSVKTLSSAGKRKMSPPKKTIRANNLKRTTFGNTTPTPGTTQTPSEMVIIPESPQKSSGSSSSSSSLNLNSWDGLIDVYFEDVSNNNIPIRQELASNYNVDLSVVGA